MRIIYQIIYYLFWDQEIKMPLLFCSHHQVTVESVESEGWKKLEGQNIILRKLPVSVVWAGDVVL